ncbi:MAG TPA: M48 family peptidase, partial [Candidatus Omnitrophota bacterium]|nr:M48 family peptidase [Candidatus Omnitrophota bacterium]
MRIVRTTVAMLALGVLAGCGEGSTGLGLNLVPEGQVRQMGLEAWQEIRSETPATRDRDMQARAERV